MMLEYSKIGEMLIENKQENVKEMLFGGKNERFFFLIVLSLVFHDYRLFEIRNDIFKSEYDVDGDILVCDDGNVIYFKYQEDELDSDEFENILTVCYYLQDKCGGNIEAYLLCSPEVEFRSYDNINREGIAIRLASLKSFDGDEVIRLLEYKRRNKERFTFLDQIYHLLLPYMGCVDKDEYISKVQNYLFETLLDNVENRCVEVIR